MKYGAEPPSIRAARVRGLYLTCRLFVRAARKACENVAREPCRASEHYHTAVCCLLIAGEARDAAREARRSLRADLNQLFSDLLPQGIPSHEF